MKRLTAGSLASLVLLTAAACGHSEAALTHPIFFPCPDFRVDTGTIEIPITSTIIPLGDAVLFVPANAVDSPIEVEVRRGTRYEDAATIEFTPKGAPSVTFAHPVTLLMSYARCGVDEASAEHIAIYRTDVNPPNLVRDRDNNPTGKFVTGSLRTLSDYSTAHPH